MATIRSLSLEERRAYNRERMQEWRKNPNNREKGRAYSRKYNAENAELVKVKNRAFQKKRQDEAPEYLMLNRARKRAKIKNIPFDLELSDINIPETCPVLGIPLAKYNRRGTSLRNSPSLDRIKPELGYVKGNIIVVSHKANSIKNDASVDEILAVGKFYENLERQKSSATETTSARESDRSNTNSEAS